MAQAIETRATQVFRTVFSAIVQCARLVTGFVNSRRIIAAALRLGEQARQIPAAVAVQEQRYLAMHGSLAELGPAARELLQRGQRLAGLASGRDSVEANTGRALAVIESVLRHLAETQRPMSKLIGGLCEARQDVRALLGYEVLLAEALAPLDYVQLMMRIEAARLPTDQQHVFVALAGEIAELCSSTRRLAAANLESVKLLGAALGTAIARLESRYQKRETTLAGRRADIMRALEQLDARSGQASHCKPRVTSATAGLEREVGCAVMALQTHDMVSQRLEHTRTALLDSVTAANQYARARDPGHALKVQALLRVEEEQIASVIEDLEENERELKRSVGAIHAHLATLDEDFLTFQAFSEGTTSKTGSVHVLLESFAATRELLAETTSLTSDSETLIRPCSSLTQDVTNAMRDIAFQMRNIALNAQIHAIRIGDGTGLEVLAANASSISSLTSELGRQTAETVARISASLAGSQISIAALRDQCEVARETVETEVAAEEQLLHDFRNSAVSEVNEIGVIVARAHDASSCLWEHADCSAMLGLLQQVRSEAKDAKAVSAIGLRTAGTELGTMASDLRSHYTMSRERLAHSRALGLELPSGTEPPEEHPGDSESIGTVFAEGVELF